MKHCLFIVQYGREVYWVNTVFYLEKDCILDWSGKRDRELSSVRFVKAGNATYWKRNGRRKIQALTSSIIS